MPSPTILNQVTLGTPDDVNHILSFIKTTAESWGWQIQDYRTNVKWDETTPYTGWEAGTESFLQMKTTGYGSQNCIMRFRTIPLYNTSGYHDGIHSHDWNNTVIEVVMTDPRYPSYNTGVATHPVDQNPLTENGSRSYRKWNRWALAEAASVFMWIHGNDRVMYVSVQLDAINMTHLSFGVPELIDTAWDGGEFMAGWNIRRDSYWDFKWNYRSSDQSMDNPQIRIPGSYTKALTGYESIAPAFRETRSWVRPGPGGFDQVLIPSNWSGIRPMEKDLWWYLDNTEGVYRPFAYTPWLYVSFIDGLYIGQELTYGTERYCVLPIWGYMYNADDNRVWFPGTYGVGQNLLAAAFRVA